MHLKRDVIPVVEDMESRLKLRPELVMSMTLHECRPARHEMVLHSISGGKDLVTESNDNICNNEDEDDDGRIIEDSDQEDLEPELDGSRRRHERSERPADPGVMEDEMFTAALGELTTTLGSRYNLDHIDDD
ncbi:hypothetical protein E4U24_004434 [Claviceps purpurea]|nr:hypothetical protein E4U24_004434 [Claviceps purpurea]